MPLLQISTDSVLELQQACALHVIPPELSWLWMEVGLAGEEHSSVVTLLSITLSPELIQLSTPHRGCSRPALSCPVSAASEAYHVLASNPSLSRHLIFAFHDLCTANRVLRVVGQQR